MKKIKIIVIFLFVLGLITVSIGVRFDNINRKKQQIIDNHLKLKKQITSHYSIYVKTNKESKLYTKENNKYIEYGLIGKNIELTLSSLKITPNTKYFYITDLKCYIPYENVSKITTLSAVDNLNYKKYLPFNENIVTKTDTTFYNNQGLVYKIHQGLSLPIIIKNTDKYYVEYNNKLLYVKSNEVTTVAHHNTEVTPRTNIRTLTYHTIYNPDTETCTNESICHPISQFDAHMKYLSDNNYLTLTMADLELFLNGNIRIPPKSIVITLDDGEYYINAVNIVEKYKVYATYFIITSVYDVSKTKTAYMSFQSHTNNMHNNYKCPGGNQGGEFLCADKAFALKDLKTSQEKLGGAYALSYPFFDFNERAIAILKEAGFRLAFIGQYNSDGYSTPKTNHYLLRRKTIFKTDSMATFISYLK